MILTMTEFHENLLRDSPLSLLSIVKLFSSLETKMILQIPNKSFLRITRYSLLRRIQACAPLTFLFTRSLIQSLTPKRVRMTSLYSKSKMKKLQFDLYKIMVGKLRFELFKIIVGKLRFEQLRRKKTGIYCQRRKDDLGGITTPTPIM